MSSETNPSRIQGELFLISAPSGAGKTTLIGRALAELGGDGGLGFSVSHTTREPRPGERDGREYHFVDPARFQSLIEEGELFEWAEVHGNLYGTSQSAIEPFLAAGVDMLVDLDVQGAEQLMRRFPAAHSIFVLPPTHSELVIRLEGRALDDREQIARRLSGAIEEVRRYAAYDYVIVNDDAPSAARTLVAILLEKRCRRSRMEPRVRELLVDFERASAAAGSI